MPFGLLEIQLKLTDKIVYGMRDLKPCHQNLLRRSNCPQWKTLSQRMRMMMMSYSPKKWKKRQAWKKTTQSRWRWARPRKRRGSQMYWMIQLRRTMGQKNHLIQEEMALKQRLWRQEKLFSLRLTENQKMR